MLIFRLASSFITLCVPLMAMPSSSLVMRKPMRALSVDSARKRSVAVNIAAMLPFMSAAPLPCRKPSATVALNGGYCQELSGPVGTTSVWPANTNRGPLVPSVAHRFVTSSNCNVSTLNPLAVSRFANSS